MWEKILISGKVKKFKHNRNENVKQVPLDKGVLEQVDFGTNFLEPPKAPSRPVRQNGGVVEKSVNRRKAGSRPRRIVAENEDNSLEISDFIDPEYWKMEKVCCGTVFRGLNGEMLIDDRFMNPCTSRSATANDLKKSDGNMMDTGDEDVDEDYVAYSGAVKNYI